MFAIADDLGIGVGRGHSGANNTGLTVMEAALAVIGMRKAAGASIDGGGTLIIGGIRVANAGHDALCAQSRSISGSTIALGRHGALDDSTAGGLLPLVKNFLGRVDQISRVLGTHMLHGKERTLQIDALNTSTAELGSTLFVRLCNGSAGVLDLLHTVGKGRRQPAGGTTTSELGRADVDTLGIIIGRGMVIEAMNVGVHHARRNPCTRIIFDLASRLIGLPSAKDAIFDHEVAAQLRPRRQKELVGLDSIRAHLCSRTRSAF